MKTLIHSSLLTLVLCLTSNALAAQNWSAGSSPVISAGESIIVDSAEPSIVRFVNNGTLTFEAGASVTLLGNAATTPENNTSVGSGSNQAGALIMNGGTITKQGGGDLFIGHEGGTGALFVASGALLQMPSNTLYIAANNGEQRQQLSKGDVVVEGTINCRQVMLSAWFLQSQTPPFVKVATLTLNPGGIFVTGSLAKNDTTESSLFFNGGTLRFRDNSADAVVGQGKLSMKIADGQKAVFDTNGKNITIRAQGVPYNDYLKLVSEGPIGDGGLKKIGTGLLKFTLAASDNTFTGAIEVVAGTLDLGRALAPNQSVTVHPGANFVMYNAADADKVILLGDPEERLLYSVGGEADTLDLTAVNHLFYDDRIGGPPADTATLKGMLTFNAASGVSGTPFRMIGQGGTLNVTNTGLESKYIQIEGPGTINFMGDRTYTAADSGKLLITDGGFRQDKTFAIADASAATPASLTLTNGRFNAGASLDVGVNGFGEFNAAGVTASLTGMRAGGANGKAGSVALSAGTMTVNGTAWVGFDGGTGTLEVTGGQLIVNGDLRVAGNPGDQTARVLRPEGFVSVSNALVRCNVFNFTPWWPSDGGASTFERGWLTLQKGAVMEMNQLVKNDDPISTIVFNGGLIRSRADNDNFLAVGQSNGKLRVVAADGEFAVFDTAGRALTIKGSAGSQLIFSGAGGFKKLGINTLSFSANQVAYAGDTVVEAGTLKLGSSHQIPDGAGKGDLRIAAGATVDLAGYNEVINRVNGLGFVTNSVAGISRLEVMGDNSDDTWETPHVRGNISIDKQGSGTLSIISSAAIPTNATISAGSVRLASCEGFPCYRFKVEGIKNSGTANAMQIAELALFNGAQNVTPDRIGIQYDSTGGTGGNPEVSAFPAGEMPEKAVDNIVAEKNKWLDFRMKASRSAADKERVWLRIDFAGIQKITSYNWATGGDDPERDPSVWRLQGSYNGTDWVDIDVQSGFNAPDDRNVWVAPNGFMISSANNPDSISDNAIITVIEGATLHLDHASESLGGLSGAGTVSLDSADLTLSTPAGTGSAFIGPITGNGSVVKIGVGQQWLAGANTFTGDLTVEQGTLTVIGSAPASWFRYTIKENNGDTATQLSELALYSADDVRRNLNLTKGSSVSSLLPGQFATPANYSVGKPTEDVDKLFDNDTATKLCFTVTRPVLNNPNTWRTIVMRLADNTPAITCYNLCTANDGLNRSPVTWTLECSFDGIAWSEVDVRTQTATPSTFFTWFNGSVPYTFARPATGSTAGDAIPDSAVVEVRAGATLAVENSAEIIGALRVDLQDAGTLTLLNPKPNGAIHIVNASGPPATWELPLTIGSVVNPAALKSWGLYVDGVLQRGYLLSYDPVTGKLHFSVSGTVLMVR